MAGTIISAFGRRSLFATFLTPKTFLFRPFVVSPAPVLSQTRHSSASRLAIFEAGPNQLISPYKSGFEDQLQRAGVDTRVVARQDRLTNGVFQLQSAIKNAIKDVPIITSDQAFHLGTVERLNTEPALLHAIVPVLFPDANKHDRYQTGVDEKWLEQPALCPELSACFENTKQLTEVKPDRFTGFILSPWAGKWPHATQYLRKMMSPFNDVAFPFFGVEGKSRNGKEVVAHRQNLSSMSLALRNIRYLHDAASTIANRELNKDPGQHVSTYLSNFPRIHTYSLNANINLIGASDASITVPSTASESVVSQLAPYTDFDTSVVLISAILTPYKVHLNAHWRSSTSLPAKEGIEQITNGCSYHSHRLMSWNTADGLEQAKVAIDTGIEHVANALEVRLKTYMTILEKDLQQKKGLQNVDGEYSSWKDNLVWI